MLSRFWLLREGGGGVWTNPLKKENLEQKLSFQMFNELLKSCKK